MHIASYNTIVIDSEIRLANHGQFMDVSGINFLQSMSDFSKSVHCDCQREIPEARNVGEVTPFGRCTCALQLAAAISVVIRPNLDSRQAPVNGAQYSNLQLGWMLTSL